MTKIIYCASQQTIYKNTFLMNEKPSTAKLALKWGAITGVASILLSTLLYLTDQTGNQGVASLIYLIPIAGLVLAMREYKQLNDNYMSYGEGLGLGALVGAVSGLLSSTYSVIYMTFIDSTVMQRTMDKMREKYEEQGMDDAQIDKIMEMSQSFQSPGLLFIFGVLGTIFLSVVFSLVIAAVLRRNKPVFD